MYTNDYTNVVICIQEDDVRFLLCSIPIFACNTTKNLPPPTEETTAHCVPDLWPYPANNPFTGIHGNAANNDIIPCKTASTYEQSWHALRAMA